MVDDIRGESRRRSVPFGEALLHPASEEIKFVPPEEIAREEEIIDMASAGTSSTGKSKEKSQKLKAEERRPKGPKKPNKFKVWLSKFKAWWKRRSKKQKIAIAAGVVLGLILAAGGIYYVVTQRPKPQPKPTVQRQEEKKPPPKPTTEPSRLTGLTVPIEANLLPVTGIMIENSPDARPQSGLESAGVVFEAIAEGGITRFMALYQEAQPDYVGPVRSARPYYLQWLQGFDAAIAHVGGSGDALSMIHLENIKDLDQSFNGGSYHRISQRYAPHNMYTSLGSMLALSKSKGYTASNFTGFARKPDKALKPVTALSINIAISGPLYDVHYDYDNNNNNYKRSQAGAPHLDERSGQQISPKVVIALVMAQGSNGIYTTYQAVGHGVAYIFQDGGVTQGTWSKEENKTQFRFGDANGAPLGINAGQTWITIVGSPTNVTFTP